MKKKADQSWWKKRQERLNKNDGQTPAVLDAIQDILGVFGPCSIPRIYKLLVKPSMKEKLVLRPTSFTCAIHQVYLVWYMMHDKKKRFSIPPGEQPEVALTEAAQKAWSLSLHGNVVDLATRRGTLPEVPQAVIDRLAKAG